MKSLRLLFETLKGEAAVGLVTGLLAFGIVKLLAPITVTAGVAFALVAAMAAGALDTLYFHLMYTLSEAPLHTAEKRHLQSIDDARQRLSDGSIRLREALIRRFEADYQRTRAHAFPGGRRTRRQLRAARQWLAARLWVMDHVVPGDQLAAANAEVKTKPELLDTWTDRVDGLVDARIEVQRREGFGSKIYNYFQPSRAARQTLAEWRAFAQNS